MRLTTMLALTLLPCALRAAGASLPSAPPGGHADTESATNAVVCVAGLDGNRFRVSLELDAATNNCVLVEFGTDADEDGALGRGEVAVSIGWDCGEWVCRDRTGCEFAAAAQVSAVGRRRLDFIATLDGDGFARSLVARDGGEEVFDGAEVPPSLFCADWNMARVVRRGVGFADESASYGLFTAPVRIILR